MRIRPLLGLSLLLLAALSAHAAGARDFLSRSDEWFASPEAARLGENILSWQSEGGGWPKNTDTTKPFAGDRSKLQGTFDNGATTDELRFLARMIGAPNSSSARSCSNAFTRGLAHILAAQYTNGGWPQYSPPPANKYHRHITFNDNSMTRLMIFLREVATEKGYDFVPREQRAAAQRAFRLGVDCILRCQIKVNGQLTGWCAQHDEIDFRPQPARTFELASLSGSESVGLVRLLMSIENPSPEIVRAVDAAVAWLESAKISGLELAEVKDADGRKDKVVKNNPAAEPMWARFYEIETGKPIYAGRDGVKKYSLAEIERERRTGYSWLGTWPESLLEKDYPKWKQHITKPQAPSSR
jgi:PelA/Pel-15E family pectate lyase